MSIKENIGRFFTSCYEKMTTDTGRVAALAIYYIFKGTLFIAGATLGLSSLHQYLP